MKSETKNQLLQPSDLQSSQKKGYSVRAYLLDGSVGSPEKKEFIFNHDGQYINIIDNEKGLYYLNAGKIVFSRRINGEIDIFAHFTTDFYKIIEI